MEIIGLLLKEFTRWVVLGILIAWPLAYYFLNKWLQNYYYRIDLSIWMFVVSDCIAVGISVLTIIIQAVRAAKSIPVETLRYE
jgi:putative ABC transport system permease protein